MNVIALFIFFVHYVRFEAFFPMLSLGSLVIMNFLASFHYFLLSVMTDILLGIIEGISNDDLSDFETHQPKLFSFHGLH